MAFAELQAAYSTQGVALYPLGHDKHPAIRGYEKVGTQGSSQLAMKFPAAEAAGFCAGRRNKLTVVDIDSTDDRLVDEIQARFGETPFQVVTPSGGRHLYYRHGNEPRQIRPLPDVDILGAGNVVAALSVVPKGRYQIERGTLDDLRRVPPMQNLAAAAAKPRVERGRRNTALFQHCQSVVARCDTLDDLLDCARTWASDRLEGELPDEEITKTCLSVWNYRGGRKRIMNQIVESPQWANLVADPDALALMAYLSAENGDDAEFMIADGLGAARGWPQRFVPSGRKKLLELGIIRRTKPAAPGRAAFYRWAVPWFDGQDMSFSTGLPRPGGKPGEEKQGKVIKDSLSNSTGLAA
ncbi:bifunctional DNA primase/polymerase [Dongia sedimenti]|uniref:Bifunctional DNA primase/polymerase n=1 Tax=Dongia sedimenti TaxID=3064282 RepID=A0ABU0YXC7_9PROT|nr:bifunctional DNA primase/polymerase [Rhodospirillaceae bacterium R-7]